MRYSRLFSVAGALALALTLTLVGPIGCGDDSDDSGSEGEGEGEGEGEFAGGQFDISTHEASDQCAEGALEVLFMPEGAATPKQFQYPIEIPAFADLPATYEIQLQDPFGTMEITMEDNGDGGMKVDDALNADVLLDEDTYGDCLADLTISFDVTIVDTDHINAAVQIGMSHLRGEQCPELQSDDCTISLGLQGERIP